MSDEHDLELICAANDEAWLNEQLKAALQSRTTNLTRIAAIIKRLDDNKQQILVESRAMPFLRRVAHGAILPELYIALEGDTHFLKKAGAMPAPDQKLIANNSPVKVMELDGDHRSVPALKLLPAEIDQVIADGRFRNDTEQVAYLRSRLRQADSISVDESPVWKYSRKDKGITVLRPGTISKAEIEQIHKSLCKARSRQRATASN